MKDGTLLVVNPGSSSIKLSLLGPHDDPLGAWEAAGVDSAGALADFLGGVPAPAACAVRVVHGGARFRAATLVDGDVLSDLRSLADLAPLHNPPAIAAIEHLRQERPQLPVIACFDTGFFADLPPEAATYAVPWRWTEEWGIRRFGFHGLSHAYAGRRAAQLLARDPDGLRIVTCHLGAGASLAAQSGGVPLDTTMGFTPMDGLVMATRSGAVDPGVLLWVEKARALSPAAVEQALDRESGLLGISGVSSDMREVLRAESDGVPRAQLALAVYLHRLAASIAAMVAALGGMDALVFTGGVGEHAVAIRARAAARLAHLGVELDMAANARTFADGDVSAPGAPVRTAVVTAREDLEMARQVRALLAARG